MHFKTQGNSFFIKTFFHTKFGNFGHLEGGQVSESNERKRGEGGREGVCVFVREQQATYTERQLYEETDRDMDRAEKEEKRTHTAVA